MPITHDPSMLMVLLWAAHFFFDFAGQGDFMANAKNHEKPIPTISPTMVLFAHSFIHAAAVFYLTGAAWAFPIVFFTHYLIDYLKCANRFGFIMDQVLHLVVVTLIGLAVILQVS